MSTPILQAKQPLRFEGRNIRTPKRSNSTDDVYLVQFEVTREVWEALESIPKIAILEGIIWHHDGAAPHLEEEKKTKERGPYGRYWQAMFGERFIADSSELREALEVEQAKDVRLKLREALGVESLTFAAPPDFEEWAEGNRLHGMVSLSRQVAAKLGVI